MELLLFLSVFSVVGYIVVEKFDYFLLLFVRQIFLADLILEIVIELYCTFVIA